MNLVIYIISIYNLIFLDLLVVIHDIVDL